MCSNNSCPALTTARTISTKWKFSFPTTNTLQERIFINSKEKNIYEKRFRKKERDLSILRKPWLVWNSKCSRLNTVEKSYLTTCKAAKPLVFNSLSQNCYFSRLILEPNRWARDFIPGQSFLSLNKVSVESSLEYCYYLLLPICSWPHNMFWANLKTCLAF